MTRPVLWIRASTLCGAVALAARLSVRLGRNIPAWVVWQYPTIGALARGLENPAQKREPRAVFGWPGEPVAIVGMGCRLPGDIADRYQLWEFLVGGGDGSHRGPQGTLGLGDVGWRSGGSRDEHYPLGWVLVRYRVV